MGNQLAEAGATEAETMLGGIEQIMGLHMGHNVVSQYFLKNFDEMGREGYGSVILRDSTAASLVYGYHMSCLEGSWDLSAIQRFPPHNIKWL